MLARIIPTRIHGLTDYAMGILLIISPWLFGFADETTAGTWIAVIAGVAILGLNAMTDHEVGLSRSVPMRTHLMMDAALGIVLIISPWVFGFADEGTNAWLPFVLFGLGELGAAALTDTEPTEARTGRRTTAERAV
jgi:hypothetical protein